MTSTTATPKRDGSKKNMPRLVTPMGVWERTTAAQVAEGDTISIVASNASAKKVDDSCVTIDEVSVLQGGATRQPKRYGLKPVDGGPASFYAASTAVWKLIERAETTPVAPVVEEAERAQADLDAEPSRHPLDGVPSGTVIATGTVELDLATRHALAAQNERNEAKKTADEKAAKAAARTSGSSTPRAAKPASPAGRLANSIKKFDEKMQPVMVELAKAIDNDDSAVKDLLLGLCQRPSLDGQPGSFGSGVAAILSWSLQEHREAGKRLAGK